MDWVRDRLAQRAEAKTGEHKIEAEILTVWRNLYDACATAVKLYADANQGPTKRPSISQFANGEFVIVMNTYSESLSPKEHDRITVNLNKSGRQIISMQTSRRDSGIGQIVLQVGIYANGDVGLLHNGQP